MNTQRLDKIISTQLPLSRREARRDIKIGKVTVDGNVIKDFGYLADAENQKIEYNGQAVEYKKYIYIVMNKPQGIISASNDKSRQTVVDLVPENLRRAGLFPVGRLDRDTTGILLITDDGEFGHTLTSPKKNISKVYEALLDGEVSAEACGLFEKGIILADGTRCAPAALKPLNNCKALVKITEGKYHQIKRMFGVVGLGVNGLKRISIGGLRLPADLKEGECRELTMEEFDGIFKVFDKF